MSTTLSMTTMVTMLQRKTGLGLAQSDCVDRLNEAFRAINQRSKGGFVWQLKNGTLVFPAYFQSVALPSDFDPGKTAILRGDGSATPLNTVIPYLPWKDFASQVHYQTTQQGFISAWTFFPLFSGTTSYFWYAQIGPISAIGSSGYTLPFLYHAVNFPPVSYGSNNYFPTPDQFDSLIVDLAVAEVKDIYALSGAQALREKTNQAINEIIDTYRTDRYDLAGVSDNIAQAQEKQVEGTR